MALIDMSAAEAISRTLNSAPNSRIDPRLWLELSRVHSAIKEMAALTDAISNPPGGDYSGVPVNMYLQEQTVVTAVAGEALEQYRPVKLEYSGGQLTAFYPFVAGSPLIYTRADAITTAPVAAGATGQFVLRGIAPAARLVFGTGTLSDQLTAWKSRIYSIYNGTNDQGFFSTQGVNNINKPLPLVGTFIHAYSASTLLIYFNPHRDAINRAAG
jgi:hypothetical protein